MNPKTIPCNMNGYVYVRMTPTGREIIRKHYDDLSSRVEGRPDFSPLIPKEDGEGWSRWLLWQLMELMGPHCGMGCEIPFEMTIRIEPEKE